ncbi:unnamed protein product [Spirodela intermedia]|uniref:Remorin C-terminal domain-containing protein n=1 Tax=Spirodela intermedia TaxID=51605 RepID=A0A7I8JBA0_SPIIN|nr:unnamed protein product [Spirodela intermedia]CAA6667369.1 unnamed protein product [Spirodela intermedia]
MRRLWRPPPSPSAPGSKEDKVNCGRKARRWRSTQSDQEQEQKESSSNLSNPSDSGRISRWLTVKEGKEDRDSAGELPKPIKEGRARSLNGQEGSLFHRYGSKRFAGAKGNASAAGKNTLSSSTSRRGETQADAWERAEMAKIRKRYEKMHSAILEWEKEKKHKKVALQNYRDEVNRVGEIADGARMAADEKKRNDERKVMEKANEIRSTGKVSSTCFCF